MTDRASGNVAWPTTVRLACEPIWYPASPSPRAGPADSLRSAVAVCRQGPGIAILRGVRRHVGLPGSMYGRKGKARWPRSPASSVPGRREASIGSARPIRCGRCPGAAGTCRGHGAATGQAGDERRVLRAGLLGRVEPEAACHRPDPGHQPAAPADVRVLPAGRDGPGDNGRAAGCVRGAPRCDQDPEPFQRRARPRPGDTAAGHRRTTGGQPPAHSSAAAPSEGQAAAEAGSMDQPGLA